jgi:hypothetical protein
MKQEEFDRLVHGDMQRLIKKGQADYEAKQAKAKAERDLYNKKRQEPMEETTRYRPVSDNVRIADMDNNEHEVQKKVGNKWEKHWGTNSMSNDMAYTELEKTAKNLAEKTKDWSKAPPKFEPHVYAESQKRDIENKLKQKRDIQDRLKKVGLREEQEYQEKLKNPQPPQPPQKGDTRTPKEKRDFLMGRLKEIGEDFSKKYPQPKMAKGGKINLKDCSVSTHSPSKKSSNW